MRQNPLVLYWTLGKLDFCLVRLPQLAALVAAYYLSIVPLGALMREH